MEDIRHELTMPKMSQQNGVVKSLNQTLVLIEMARSMLLDSKLPKKFWGKAILIAIYLKNRNTSQSIKQDTIWSVVW